MAGHCWQSGIRVNPLPVLLQHPLGTALPQVPVPCRDTCTAPWHRLSAAQISRCYIMLNSLWQCPGEYYRIFHQRGISKWEVESSHWEGTWALWSSRKGWLLLKECSKSCSKPCLLLCWSSVWASSLAEVLGCTNYQWWAGTCLCSVGIVSLMRSCVLFTLQVVGSSLDEIYFSACLAVCDVSSQYHSSPCMNMKKERDICAHVYAGLLILITIMLFSCFVDQSPFSSPR